MASYTAKDGDTIIALAYANGFKSADDILNDSENSSLKTSRTDPGVLLKGDTVTIPSRILRQEAKPIDASHKFIVTRPKAWIRMAVKDAHGVALAGKKYQLTVDGKQTSGTVPDGGVIEQAVPASAKAGQLTVWLSNAPTDMEIWELQLGWMDPLDSITGVQARLINLGFDIGHDPDGVLDDGTKFAINTFQARIGIDVTGAIDDTLKQKLTAYYDPAQDETTQDAPPPTTTTTGGESTS
ncbi:MAG TPA: peptidoglycan-binding domain-containing protein [Thermoanaerobaculia bacterium]